MPFQFAWAPVWNDAPVWVPARLTQKLRKNNLESELSENTNLRVIKENLLSFRVSESP